MEADAFYTSLDLVRSNNDNCHQSSDEPETHNGNVDGDAVHNTESKETEPEAAGPHHIIHTHSQCDADSSYTVTCTVSMVLAVPRGYGEDDPVVAAEKERQLKKVQSKCTKEAPRAQAYYHIEYNLLPDDSEPIKVDLVMFGEVVKVYMDNETKVLKAWQEGYNFWLGWSQSVKLSVTREMLIKMSLHKITFRLWDTKDKVSPKAKYDRPKTFILPQERRMEDPEQRGASVDCGPETESAGGIKGMVDKLRALYKKQNPIITISKKWQKDIPMDYKRPSKLKSDRDDPKMPITEASRVCENPGSSVILKTDGSLAQETELTNKRYAEKQSRETTDAKIKSKATVDQEKVSKFSQKQLLHHFTEVCKDTATIASTKSGTMKASSLVVSKKKHAHNTVQDKSIEEDIGVVASAELKAMYFLAGKTSMTEHLVIHSRRVFKVLCDITLDQPLMSEKFKAELNPLIITILSATSLPSTPVPFCELEQKCMPVYCQYKFHNMPAHRTKGLSHGVNIYFKDVNVILTGLLSTKELFELLRGPPLEIEVHDRDRKAEEPSSKSAMFGTKATDDKLSSTALVSTKQIIYSPSRDLRKQCPYGIAKLNFSDLIRRHGCMKLSLPIRASHPGHWRGNDKNELGENEPETARALDAQDTIPNGHYLLANSELKVHVEIAHPLNPDQSEGHCPFGYIIYIFKYNNISLMKKLRSEMSRINAVAFQVDCYSKEMAEEILQNHLMDATERENKFLNALTGFHIMDTSLHLFVLEGLMDQAIKMLWETIPIKLVEDIEKHVTVLYNSALTFSKRVYDTLDVGLSPIYLHKPLENIMRQPLVYIRDTVPYPCLQAMLRINHLRQVSKLEEVIKNNLLPSAEMLISLRNEFGIVPRRGMEKLQSDSSKAEAIFHPPVLKSRGHTPIDHFNKDYLAWKQNQLNQGLQRKNFIQANIEDIQKCVLQKSDLKIPKPRVFVAKVDDGQSAHNYSIQTMNCTILAKELLYKEMAKEPAHRFTYCQLYHSFTVDPLDIEAVHKASEVRSQAAWRTSNGFISYNLKDSMESNQHPKHPDAAWVEELRKPWKENILHENTLNPVLNRTTWPWSKRHEDFELYKKPPQVLSPVPPITIHLAGETLQEEQLQAAHAQYSRWLRKVLPDKESAGCNTVPEFKCHMKRVGLDKLNDLLKDKPMKLSLRARKGCTRMPYTSTQKKENLEPTHLSDIEINSRHTSKQSQFGCYWRPHSFLHKRTALPLTDEEKSLHVFQKPQNTTKIHKDLDKTQ